MIAAPRLCCLQSDFANFNFRDGFATEAERAVLLFQSTTSYTDQQRHERLQALSQYQIPLSWNLPIEMIDLDMNAAYPKDPMDPDFAQHSTTLARPLGLWREILEASQMIHPPKLNSPYFGWVSGLTTITSRQKNEVTFLQFWLQKVSFKHACLSGMIHSKWPTTDFNYFRLSSSLEKNTKRRAASLDPSFQTYGYVLYQDR